MAFGRMYLCKALIATVLYPNLLFATGTASAGKT